MKHYDYVGGTTLILDSCCQLKGVKIFQTVASNQSTEANEEFKCK